MTKFSSFFPLLLICLIISLANTVYFIQDLQGSSYATFNTELATWTASPGATMTPSDSSPRYLLFSVAYNRLQVQKTFSGIDDHDYIAFSLGMYMESSCTGNVFQMSFDGVQTQMLVAKGLNTGPTGMFYIKGGVPHSGSTLTVTFIRKITSSCGSFRIGIRELNMNFIKNLQSTEQQFCHTYLKTPQLSPVCQCGPTQTEELPCASCSTGCLRCGGIIGGIETCSKCDSTKFFEWDGEACSTCGSKCTQCAGKMGNDCMSCLGGYFKYADGTCAASCPSPFKETPLEGGCIGGCVVPCENSQWLYGDLSCKESCNFKEEMDLNGIKWCQSPCENKGDYYDEDKGTCKGSCPFPNKAGDIGGIKTCKAPCEDSEWLYRDLSCKENCNFKEEVDENGIKWCKSPCENQEDYFNEKEGTCKASCEYPNKAGDEVGEIKTCLLNVDESQTEQIKKTTKAVDGINSGSSGAILALSFLSSSDSSSILMGAFSKMLQYIKYMDIVYPAKVQLMLEMLNSNSSTGGFASEIMRKEMNKFPERELPEKFEYYGALSSFFINFWPSMFVLLALFFVTVVMIMLTFCFKPSVKVNKILMQIIGRLKWNMILLLFCGDFGDIVFFTSLELTTIKLSSFESVWSLMVCILMNVFAVWVMMKILSVNFKIRKEKQQQIKAQGIEHKWENYKTFFAIYKDQSYFQQIFLFIFIIRVLIFNAVIGYFFNYPFVQAILITLANLTMLLYLIFKRPMKAMINFIQQVVLEGFLLVFNICLSILAGLDHNGIEAYDFRDGIGQVMVVINLIVPIVSIVILTAKFAIMGIEIFKEWKTEKSKQKNIIDKRDIKIELPRKQKTEDLNGSQVEVSLANKSNIIDMSSSNVSFLNSSQPWINNQSNEKNSRWIQSQISNVSDLGIYDQSTGSSPYQQPYQASSVLSQEMGLSDMQGSPARKMFKKPRIKRNRTLKDERVRNGEIESVFEGA